MQGFDKIYRFYDLLARLVFGNTLEKAKASFLSTVEEGANVLIIGGGTGATLERLDELGRNLKIDYVESSRGMTRKARERMLKNIKVVFHPLPIEDFYGTGYDIIITEFFFDLFEVEKLEKLLVHIVHKLKIGGNWIDTDFRPTNNVWNRVVLKAMLIFFKLSVHMKANRLFDTKSLFRNHNLIIKNEVYFMKGFVTSRLICL